MFNSYEEAYEKRLLHLNDIKNKKIEVKNNQIDTLPILRNDKNEPIINLSTKHKSGKITNVTIKVDAHRYHELLKLGLSLTAEYVSVYKYKMVLSRYLLNCTDKLKVVDHKDGDVTNYQMNNLRIITVTQNSQNKGTSHRSVSKYVGVSFDKKKHKWRGYIKEKTFGSFDDEYSAAMARDLKAYELNLFGNMFRINLPDELQVNLFLKAMKENHFQLNYLFY